MIGTATRFGLVFTAVAVLAACSSSDSSSGTPSGGCAKDPLACGAGKTCWPKDTTGSVACLDEAAGKTEGSACQIIAGQATCASGLFCFPTGSGSSLGTCSPFCATASPSGSCASGGACIGVTLVNTPNPPLLYVCQPSGSGGTGGTSGTGGSAGSGGNAGSGGASGGAAGSGGTPSDAAAD